jgi:hypothetical protein
MKGVGNKVNANTASKKIHIRKFSLVKRGDDPCILKPPQKRGR